VHTEVPVAAAYWPATQLVHVFVDAPTVDEACPILQLVQDVVPVAVW
jgi:hypothetical protein